MLFIAYPTFGVVLMLVFIWMALIDGDPTLIPRGGALLTAFAALFLIYEAFHERASERDGEEGDDAGEGGGAPSVSPVAQVAERISRLRRQARRDRRADQRLKLVLLNSVMIVIGELIQGFGDIAFVFVFM